MVAGREEQVEQVCRAEEGVEVMQTVEVEGQRHLEEQQVGREEYLKEEQVERPIAR